MLPFHVNQSSPAGATSWAALNAGAGAPTDRCPDALIATTTLASAANAARPTKRRSFIPLLLERFGTATTLQRRGRRSRQDGHADVTIGERTSGRGVAR